MLVFSQYFNNLVLEASKAYYLYFNEVTKNYEYGDTAEKLISGTKQQAEALIEFNAEPFEVQGIDIYSFARFGMIKVHPYSKKRLLHTCRGIHDTNISLNSFNELYNSVFNTTVETLIKLQPELLIVIPSEVPFNSKVVDAYMRNTKALNSKASAISIKNINKRTIGDLVDEFTSDDYNLEASAFAIRSGLMKDTDLKFNKGVKVIPAIISYAYAILLNHIRLEDEIIINGKLISRETSLSVDGISSILASEEISEAAVEEYISSNDFSPRYDNQKESVHKKIKDVRFVKQFISSADFYKFAEGKTNTTPDLQDVKRITVVDDNINTLSTFYSVNALIKDAFPNSEISWVVGLYSTGRIHI